MDEVTTPPPCSSISAAESRLKISVDELHALTLPQLMERARSMNVRHGFERSRNQVTFDLLKAYGARGAEIFADGVLEMLSEHQAYLRWPRLNFRAGPEDVHVSPGIVRQFGLQTGNRVTGRVRMPRDRERFLELEQVVTIEGQPAATWVIPKGFDDLTPQFPTERILLENDLTRSISARAVDLLAPLGKGQRALIVSPPRVGKTILMRDIAQAIRATSPEIHLILLLIDERPEEVTDFRREVDAEVFSSTFDEPPTRHVQVAELVSERARRLVEVHKDVVIMLDSITRLARGYNALQAGKGKIMSGGVESKALSKPKKFFGAARNVEEGGSLTIIGTALVDTHSRMDEVIFEEFKGTGNMELHLDRALGEKRIFPAINVLQTATRREELLYHPAELERIHLLRKALAQLPPGEAMEVLLGNLQATETNAELLLAGLR